MCEGLCPSMGNQGVRERLASWRDWGVAGPVQVRIPGCDVAPTPVWGSDCERAGGHGVRSTLPRGRIEGEAIPVRRMGWGEILQHRLANS